MANDSDKVLFTSQDLDVLIRLSCDLALRGTGRSSRVVQLVSYMKRLLEAESAVVLESRGPAAGSLREVYRDDWRNWQSDALSNELTGMPVAEANTGPINMTWLEPESSKRQRYYALASCLPAGVNYLITLAFARRARSFTERDGALLQTVQHSELMTFISPTRSPQYPQLTRRMRQVLSQLMDGDSEKEIALRLTLSRHTVHQHIKSIYRRYGVNSRGELLSLSVDPVARQRLLM